MDNQDDPPKRKRGRPKKGEIVKKTNGTRGKVGRPKGDASIINEYKARMLASPKSRRVLDSIFDAALKKRGGKKIAIKKQTKTKTSYTFYAKSNIKTQKAM